MSKGENELVRWLQQRFANNNARVVIPIGDDLAAVALDQPRVFITTDMLLDTVHFDTAKHSYEQIGHKAIACSLSDCAGMACEPRGATVSIALNNQMTLADVQQLYEGMARLADKYDCPIIGGDTTSWANPLAIDVAMIAEPMAAEPIRRSTAQAGDTIYVSGTLGGSIRNKHMTFEPCIALARTLSTLPDVHAMMDISDGLAMDLHRLCDASRCSAELDESALNSIISDDAHTLADQDNRSALDHALSDGEDFELLVSSGVIEHPELTSVGRVIKNEDSAATLITLLRTDGTATVIKPEGYEHFK